MTVLIKIFFLVGAALLIITSAGPLTEKSNEENDIPIVQDREKRQAGWEHGMIHVVSRMQPTLIGVHVYFL